MKSGFVAQRSQRGFGQRRFGGGNNTKTNNNRNPGDISPVVGNMIESITKFMRKKNAGFNWREVTPRPCVWFAKFGNCRKDKDCNFSHICLGCKEDGKNHSVFDCEKMK